jgi:hypothetical protein
MIVKTINAKMALKKSAEIRGMGPELLPGEWKFVPGIYLLIILYLH